MVAIFPPTDYHPYTYQTIRDDISRLAQRYGVPFDLSAAIAWWESEGWNPNAAGDWEYSPGHPASPGATGAHPRSIGLFQLNREGGLGTGYAPEQLLDPSLNADIALQNLGSTPHSGLTPGQWAAASQRPGDPSLYASKIDALLASKPWENLTNNDVANPLPAGYPSNPSGWWPFDQSLLPFPGIPSDPPPGGGGGGEPAPDPGTTGSGLPDLVTADPIALGHIPGLGDITLNLTPILNWGIRIGVTAAGAGLIVYGLVVLAKPGASSLLGTAEKVAAVAA